MAVRTPPRPQRLRALKRFFRSPKGQVLIILVILTALAAIYEGDIIIPGLVGSVGAAVLVDAAIWRTTRGEWVFPTGGLLTGLIIALVLSSQEPWYVPVGTSALAIASKHLIRTPWANIFNPAALALVLSSFIFASGQSWWGALPDPPPIALLLLIGAGIYLVNFINKLPVVLTFLATYYALFTAMTFVGDPGQVAEVFRVPDVNAALFFAFFMLDDPPTSPVRYDDQVRFGLIVGMGCFLAFVFIGGVYYLPLGLLVGNAWEAYRRVASRYGPPMANAA
jgi:Na+-translocating ferredoxin:NAD+ oxidoreductase RnfD subunit